MGLDMCLYTRVYLSEYTDDSEIINARNAVSNIKIKGLPSGCSPEYLDFLVMYWRKANAIHNWFVQNVQGGEDDCGYHECGYDELASLLKIINTILDEDDVEQQKALAGVFLPPQEGFFFGDTEIDDWYFEDLNNTARKLEALLAERNDKLWFVYHSSW